MGVNKWALRAELTTLRSWAEQNYADTLGFWLDFADRVCAFMHGKSPVAWHAVSDLYSEFEERGALQARPEEARAAAAEVVRLVFAEGCEGEPEFEALYDRLRRIAGDK